MASSLQRQLSKLIGNTVHLILSLSYLVKVQLSFFGARVEREYLKHCILAQNSNCYVREDFVRWFYFSQRARVRAFVLIHYPFFTEESQSFFFSLIPK